MLRERKPFVYASQVMLCPLRMRWIVCKQLFRTDVYKGFIRFCAHQPVKSETRWLIRLSLLPSRHHNRQVCGHTETVLLQHPVS